MTDERDSTGQGPEDDLLGPMRAVLEALPRELPPRRDLLPAISARAWRRAEQREREGILPFWRAAGRSVRVQLAAAAAILVIVTSAVTYLALGGLHRGEIPGGSVIGTGPGSSPTVLVGARPVGLESRYAAAIGELLHALRDPSSRLSPEAREMVEENLRVIDAALEEARQALRERPDDPVLRRALVGSYERKLGFLRQAAALTAES